MKYALIADTHFGSRNDSELFLNNAKEFFDNQFFPELVKRNITNIIHLGDMFDRRKYINIKTLKTVREFFLDKLTLHNIKCTVILGNHDVYYKNTNETNSLEELIDSHPMMIVVDSPCVMNGLMYIPWINQENESECLEFIQKQKADIVFGHFSVIGGQQTRGVSATEGINVSQFKNNTLVFSGHFHQRHTIDNVVYLGTPYQLTYADLDEWKGFYIFDDETKELQEIENTNKMFVSLAYNFQSDRKTIPNVSDKYVHLMVYDKKNETHFNDFVAAIKSHNPCHLKIVESELWKTSNNNKDCKNDHGDSYLTLDTLSIIKLESQKNPKITDFELFDKIVADVYTEAMDKS